MTPATESYRDGYARLHSGDVPGALASFDHALSQDPEFTPAWAARGRARRAAGDVDGAWSDFNQALRLDPTLYTAWGSRGYLEYDLGLFEEALADFRRACENRNRGASDYHRLRMWLCEARLGREAAASRALRGWSKGSRATTEWTAALASFLVGDLTETEVLALAEAARGRSVEEQRCEALFYAGERRLIRGDVKAAVRLLRACRATGVEKFTEWRSAGAELGRVTA
jgi:lipoprotein NlpI